MERILSTWIHAAANRLSVVAGLKFSGFRDMNVWLTSLGLGFHNSSSVGFWHCLRGKLRPNLIPAQPILRISRELSLPSELRVPMYRFSVAGSSPSLP